MTQALALHLPAPEQAYQRPRCAGSSAARAAFNAPTACPAAWRSSTLAVITATSSA